MEHILAIDHQILYFISNFIRNDILNLVMIFITHLGDAGAIWILISILCLIKKQTRFIGISMLLSLVLGLIIGNVFLKNIIARPRPFKTYSDIVNLINQGGYSFPSGHTLSSFTASVSFYLCAKYQKNKMPDLKACKKRLNFGKILLVLAVLISISRLYVCVHYPTDVLFGAIIGSIIAIFVVKFMTLKFPQAFIIKE